MSLCFCVHTMVVNGGINVRALLSCKCFLLNVLFNKQVQYLSNMRHASSLNWDVQYKSKVIACSPHIPLFTTHMWNNKPLFSIENLCFIRFWLQAVIQWDQCRSQYWRWLWPLWQMSSPIIHSGTDGINRQCSRLHTLKPQRSHFKPSHIRSKPFSHISSTKSSMANKNRYINMVPQSRWSQLRKWQDWERKMLKRQSVCVRLVKQWHIQPLDEIGEEDDSGARFNKAWEWRSPNLVIKLMH